MVYHCMHKMILSGEGIFLLYKFEIIYKMFFDMILILLGSMLNIFLIKTLHLKTP